MKAFPTKLEGLPQGRAQSMERDVTEALDTMEYARKYLHTGDKGRAQAIMTLLDASFLDAICTMQCIIATMTGAKKISSVHRKFKWPTNGPRRFDERVAVLTRELREVQMLVSNDYLLDQRDEFRIPAVQGVFRAQYIIEGIINDYSEDL